MWNWEDAAAQEDQDEPGLFDPIDDAYDTWKAADAAARAIEREVHEAWRRHERGVGAPPSRGLLREMACQRHDAREKLRHAIGLLHDAGYIQPATHSGERVRGVA
jgi:hypothetical protein